MTKLTFFLIFLIVMPIAYSEEGKEGSFFGSFVVKIKSIFVNEDKKESVYYDVCELSSLADNSKSTYEIKKKSLATLDEIEDCISNIDGDLNKELDEEIAIRRIILKYKLYIEKLKDFEGLDIEQTEEREEMINNLAIAIEELENRLGSKESNTKVKLMTLKNLNKTEVENIVKQKEKQFEIEDIEKEIIQEKISLKFKDMDEEQVNSLMDMMDNSSLEYQKALLEELEKNGSG